MEPEQTQTNQQSQPSQQITTPIKPAGSKSRFSKILPFLAIVLLIVAGVISGAILSSSQKAVSSSVEAGDEDSLVPEDEEELQIVTRDEAEGTLEKNDDYDVYAQGQWKLIRPGGESQTAYLTSSYVDLDEYVGKNVKVYGETLGSDKVGWLLDVARVEELE